VRAEKSNFLSLSFILYPHPNPDRQKQLTDLIIEKMESVENVIFVALFDKNCVIAHANKDELGWDASARDYCVSLREDSKRETFVSKAFVSTLGPLNITQSRRYLPNEAGFHGFAAVGVSLDTIAAMRLRHEGSTITNHVTVSLGVATTHWDEDICTEKLLKIADKRLYWAKENGRNRVGHEAVG